MPRGQLIYNDSALVVKNMLHVLRVFAIFQMLGSLDCVHCVSDWSVGVFGKHESIFDDRLLCWLMYFGCAVNWVQLCNANDDRGPLCCWSLVVVVCTGCFTTYGIVELAEMWMFFFAGRLPW